MKIFLYLIPAALVGAMLYKTIHLLQHAADMIARAMP
jgi:hypothetical protein